MAKEKGTDLIFNIDSSVLMYAKSFEYTLSGNLVETTNLSDGGYVSYVPVGGKGVNGSVDLFVVPIADASRNVKYLINAWKNDTSVGFSFTNSSMQTVAGGCWINDIKISNSGAKDLIGGSCTFQSTGTFTIS